MSSYTEAQIEQRRDERLAAQRSAAAAAAAAAAKPYNDIVKPIQQNVAEMANAPTWQYPTTPLTPEQNPLLTSAFSGYADWMKSAPGVTADATAAASNLAAGKFDPWGGPMGGAAADTVTGMMNDGTNPYLNEMIQNATKGTLRTLNEQILPGIDARYLGAGQYGGSRQALDIGSGVRAATESIGDIAARMSGEQYNADQNRRLQGAGMAMQGQQLGLEAQRIGMQSLPGMAMLPGQIMETGAKLGMQQNQLEQLSLDKDVQAFLYNQQAQGMQMEQALQLLPYLYPEKFRAAQAGQPGQPKPNVGASVIGGALTGFAATGSPWGAAAGGLGGLLSTR